MSLPTLASTSLAAPQKQFSRQQKATIIVRLLQSEGVAISLSDLPEDLQIALTQEMSAMRYINRSTLQDVVAEFVDELDDLGVTFPRDVPGALDALEDSLSTGAATRLRKSAGCGTRGDPWEKIGAFDVERLLPVFEEEAIEIASVALSKLDVNKSAELLGKLPGERARRIAFAMSQTNSVAPETVRKIGETLLHQFETEPPKAFDTGPVERVGAILNSSPATTREDVLAGLFDKDEEFGESVRKAIFTFANIKGRLEAQDIPKVTRDADNDLLIIALAYAFTKEDEAKSADFLLDNMSQRMAAQLRDEVEATGKIKEADGEEAMSHVVSVIRELASTNEITLKVDEEEEDEEAADT